MNLSIVLSLQPTRFDPIAFKGDLEQNLEFIASLGYQGVELAIRNPAETDLLSIRQVLKAQNLALPAIGTGQAWGEERLSFTDPNPQVRQAALDRACTHIPFAAETGALIIIGLLRGTVQEGVRRSQALDWLIEALCHLTDAASTQGVRICLEPLNRYETELINTVPQGQKLIRDVGSPALGLLLDTFHMNIEEPDMLEAIDQAGECLYHFHVADSNRWYPGAGHIDFRSILAGLKKINYRGFVSGEFLPFPDSRISAQLAIAYLRKNAD